MMIRGLRVGCLYWLWRSAYCSFGQRWFAGL